MVYHVRKAQSHESGAFGNLKKSTAFLGCPSNHHWANKHGNVGGKKQNSIYSGSVETENPCDAPNVHVPMWKGFLIDKPADPHQTILSVRHLPTNYEGPIHSPTTGCHSKAICICNTKICNQTKQRVPYPFPSP